MYLEFKRNPEIPTEPETRLCVLSVLVTPTPTATPLAMPPLSPSLTPSILLAPFVVPAPCEVSHLVRRY